MCGDLIHCWYNIKEKKFSNFGNFYPNFLISMFIPCNTYQIQFSSAIEMLKKKICYFYMLLLRLIKSWQYRKITPTEAQTDLLIFDTTIAKLDKKIYFIPSGELISFNKKFLKITPDNIFENAEKTIHLSHITRQ